MLYLNISQHLTTPEQRQAGVVDLPTRYRDELVRLLTFEEVPYADDVWTRAKLIGELVRHYLKESGIRPEEDFNPNIGAMVGCALWLVGPLTYVLCHRVKVQCYFAFSKREVIEEPQPDGSVKKVSIFKHAGFVPVIPGCPGCQISKKEG